MLDHEHGLESACCWIFLKGCKAVSTRVDFKYPSRMKSPGSNALIYMAACPFGTVISSNCGSVKRTLPALEIKCYVLHGFSCLLFCTPQPANNETSSFFILPLLSMLNRFPLVLCPLSVWVNVLFQHKS